jgi:hypothetical protein
MLSALVCFWLAVVALLTGCKAQRSVEREALTEIVKTEDVKTVEGIKAVVSEKETSRMDERKDYDVTITVFSAPDSTGKQYAQKVVNVKAKEERATTTAKDSVGGSDKLRASYEQFTSELTSESKEEVQTEASAGGVPWWFLVGYAVVVAVFILRIFKR